VTQFDRTRFAGRRALVTGASRGIGAGPYPRWRVNAVTPGLTATEFTPRQAGWSVSQGAEIIVRMATVGSDGPTGTFVEQAGTVPW
jgi:hypothetical protein